MNDDEITIEVDEAEWAAALDVALVADDELPTLKMARAVPSLVEFLTPELP